MAKRQSLPGYRVGDYDYSAFPRSIARKRLYKKLITTWDREFNSTKLVIPPDVLNKFKGAYLIFHGKTSNPNQNV